MSFMRRLTIGSTIAISATLLSSVGFKAMAGTTDSIVVNGNIPTTLNIDITDASVDLATNIAAATPGTYRAKLSNFGDLGTNDADGFTVSFTSAASFQSVDGNDTISYGVAVGAASTADLATLSYANSGTVYTGGQGNVADQALFIELSQLDSDTADAGAYTLNLGLTVADN